MLNIFKKNKYIIWVVDDRVENQIMISNSFIPIIDHVVIVKINSCDEYYQKVDNCLNANRPHIILMDYFMGENYGTDLVDYIKFKRHLIGHPVIVGHSSNIDASREIVKVGGDFVMEKIKGLQRSEQIVKNFNSKENLIYIINHRRLPN
jgi:CheY-like chemotaxis protein